MYSKYQYLSGVQATVQANILADIVALVTGETNVANLSASCDKVNSQIISTVAAGWALHDAAAGTNARCIKAPFADDANAFKYAVIDTNTNGSIYMKVYEGWNATTHTGTNLCSNNVQFFQQFDTVNGGTIHVFATARYLCLASKLTTGAFGSGTYNGASGCFERTRFCPFDTPARGFPPFVYLDFGYSSYAANGVSTPRKMERTGAFSVGTSATLDLVIVPYGIPTSLAAVFSGQGKKILDASGQSMVPIFPVMVSDNVSSFANLSVPYGSLTDLCNIWAVPGGILGTLETVQLGGVDYLNLYSYQGYINYLIRKG